MYVYVCISLSLSFSLARSLTSRRSVSNAIANCDSRVARSTPRERETRPRSDIFRCTRGHTKFNGSGDDDDNSDVASRTPWRSRGLLYLAPASRAAPYGASAIIGELRCLFGGASADQSRLAARSSPVLAFVSLLAAAPYRPVTSATPFTSPSTSEILRVRSQPPRAHCTFTCIL